MVDRRGLTIRPARARSDGCARGASSPAWERPRMNTIIALHVIVMFFAFAFTTGVGIALNAISASQDVRAIRAAARVMRPFSMAGGILLLIGIIFGFGSASAAGFPLSSLWLIITYISVALIIIFAF